MVIRHRQTGDYQLEPERALSRGDSGGEDHLQLHAALARRLEIRDPFAGGERGGRAR